MPISVLCSSGAPWRRPTTNILMLFGDRIRQIRKEQNLSEVELAWKVGITRAHLQDIEQGAEQVDLAMLARLSSALHMTVSAAVQSL